MSHTRIRNGSDDDDNDDWNANVFTLTRACDRFLRDIRIGVQYFRGMTTNTMRFANHNEKNNNLRKTRYFVNTNYRALGPNWKLGNP
jgi:hypothetical protein